MLSLPFFLPACKTIASILAVWVTLKIWGHVQARRRTTHLRGPPRRSILYGTNDKFELKDRSPQMVEWISKYGGVFSLPVVAGMRWTVLCDPVGLEHVYASDEEDYDAPQIAKISLELMLGKGNLLSLRGEEHKRKRRVLAPAFNNTAIRRLVPVFSACALKVTTSLSPILVLIVVQAKTAWNDIVDDGVDGAIIEVQQWMSRISLDIIGLAGFGHDFGTLEGKESEVADALQSTASLNMSKLQLAFIALMLFLPYSDKLPNPAFTPLAKLNQSLDHIATLLLDNAQGGYSSPEVKSLLEVLATLEEAGAKSRMHKEEIISQMKLMLIAGYETTSAALTWALIELAQNEVVQNKLRQEIFQIATDEITWEDLASRLPYLDGVVSETLRLHPSLPDGIRVAKKDDIIPLRKPVTTASGKLTDRIAITKGTTVFIPIKAVNQSRDVWGPDARQFKPERWITDHGSDDSRHRRIFTFIDGPKTCLGKGLAVAEMKVVLSVLVRHFAFEMSDEREVEMNFTNGITPRPRVMGEEGCCVPLRVRKIGTVE
ncbi:cytochrome P450 [Coniophora puteana RWD-64-598 SS2]|uniref:Cytochrome P450 n=1 Tax=Coniophora puteana (strain RWD-64-598) TaxID=741705 RepID=A0A5M3MWD5_CONPW|nr:cytochrome P450 [Coniophora puteana RWD-64-598 SS2]EIW83459.1 cytochrome P450 [Coniophora puteana RWD-64-598 SS2]